MKTIKNGWYPEEGTVWNVRWIFWRINRKGIAIFYHKEDRIAIFCRLKDVFCFTGDWAKSDIFQRKNSRSQQILSVFKTLCPLTSAPPDSNKGLLQNLMFCGSLFLYTFRSIKPPALPVSTEKIFRNSLQKFTFATTLCSDLPVELNVITKV